jgi:hypothetical protein
VYSRCLVECYEDNSDANENSNANESSGIRPQGSGHSPSTGRPRSRSNSRQTNGPNATRIINHRFLPNSFVENNLYEFRVSDNARERSSAMVRVQWIQQELLLATPSVNFLDIWRLQDLLLPHKESLLREMRACIEQSEVGRSSNDQSERTIVEALVNELETKGCGDLPSVRYFSNLLCAWQMLDQYVIPLAETGRGGSQDDINKAITALAKYESRFAEMSRFFFLPHDSPGIGINSFGATLARYRDLQESKESSEAKLSKLTELMRPGSVVDPSKLREAFVAAARDPLCLASGTQETQTMLQLQPWVDFYGEITQVGQAADHSTTEAYDEAVLRCREVLDRIPYLVISRAKRTYAGFQKQEAEGIDNLDSFRARNLAKLQEDVEAKTNSLKNEHVLLLNWDFLGRFDTAVVEMRKRLLAIHIGKCHSIIDVGLQHRPFSQKRLKQAAVLKEAIHQAKLDGLSGPSVLFAHVKYAEWTGKTLPEFDSDGDRIGDNVTVPTKDFKERIGVTVGSPRGTRAECPQSLPNPVQSGVESPPPYPQDGQPAPCAEPDPLIKDSQQRAADQNDYVENCMSCNAECTIS